MPVSNANLQLRFAGPELREHEMDVMLLGPSLFAFGEMCQEANRILNGEDIKLRVKLSADVKANCVTIQLAVEQSLWEMAKALVHVTSGASAHDILTYLGIFTTAAGTAGASLFKYLLWKKDQKKPTTETKVIGDNGAIIFHIVGDNNTITIPESIRKLADSPKVVESLKAVAVPVSEDNGIESAVFLEGKKRHLEIDQPTAKALQDTASDSPDLHAQVITAHVILYSPVMDEQSKKWKFKLNGKVESIDISETAIAQDALKRGHYNLGDTYKLKLELKERRTPKGFVMDYKAKDVLEFFPGQTSHQQRMF